MYIPFSSGPPTNSDAPRSSVFTLSLSPLQEFWGYFNNIPKPADVPQKSSLHLFVEGAKPLWFAFSLLSTRI
jgi:hypothetical protein